MKLEEVLPYVRKGHTPTLDGKECWSIRHQLYADPREQDIILLSDRWGYLPKLVGFNEAWKHMKLGNRVEKDGKIYSFDPIRHALCVWKYEGGDISAGWHRLSDGIPIEWIDATDFELVED